MLSHAQGIMTLQNSKQIARGWGYFETDVASRLGLSAYALADWLMRRRVWLLKFLLQNVIDQQIWVVSFLSIWRLGYCFMIK